MPLNITLTETLCVFEGWQNDAEDQLDIDRLCREKANILSYV